jgi:L-iduronidase
MSPLALAALLLAAAAPRARAALPFTAAADCSRPLAPLAPFWRSVGYTPATHALRADELENTVLIGAVPRRGVTQVRIHYMLDLVTVLGFAPDAAAPSGWALTYSWGALDFAVDFLVANNLSPGFELMGSPPGFPAVPDAFNNTFNGNGHIYPNQTLAMWRALVGDTLRRSVARYGAAEVATWHLETWNGARRRRRRRRQRRRICWRGLSPFSTHSTPRPLPSFPFPASRQSPTRAGAGRA